MAGPGPRNLIEAASARCFCRSTRHLEVASRRARSPSPERSSRYGASSAGSRATTGRSAGPAVGVPPAALFATRQPQPPLLPATELDRQRLESPSPRATRSSASLDRTRLARASCPPASARELGGALQERGAIDRRVRSTACAVESDHAAHRRLLESGSRFSSPRALRRVSEHRSRGARAAGGPDPRDGVGIDRARTFAAGLLPEAPMRKSTRRASSASRPTSRASTSASSADLPLRSRSDERPATRPPPPRVERLAMPPRRLLDVASAPRRRRQLER